MNSKTSEEMPADLNISCARQSMLPRVVSINWKTGQFLMHFPWQRRGEGVFVNPKVKEVVEQV